MMPTDTNTEHLASERMVDVPPSSGNALDSDGSVDLLNLALVLAARKRFIFLFSLIAAVLTTIIVLLVPQTYTATATMLPPQKESSTSALLGQLGGLASLAGGGGAASMLGLKNPDDLYIGFLQSETVEDAIIRRFHLMRVYKKKRLSDTRKDLKSHTTILAEKSSLISIAVKDHNPKRAAAISNAYIDQLHNLMSHLVVTEAGQRRLFFSSNWNWRKINSRTRKLRLKPLS